MGGNAGLGGGIYGGDDRQSRSSRQSQSQFQPFQQGPAQQWGGVGAGQGPLSQNPYLSGQNQYAYGQGFGSPARQRPSRYQQGAGQSNPFYAGGQRPQGPRSIWDEDTPAWQGQNGGGMGETPDPMSQTGQTVSNTGYGNPYQVTTSVGSQNPAFRTYQAARQQAGPQADLSQLLYTGAMGQNPNQIYLNQSIDPDTGLVTRYAAPTSPTTEYLKDTIPQSFASGFNPNSFDPNAALNVTGGQRVSQQGMADMGFTPDWSGVRQAMTRLQGIQGGDQYNLLGTANAPALTRSPMDALMTSLAGYNGQVSPQGTQGFMNEAARARDAAWANIFLGAQGGQISPQEANFLSNITGRSSGYGNATDPALQAGNPFQYVMGNPGENVNVTAGSNAAVTAAGANGAPGMPGANAVGQTPGPAVGTPEYATWQGGYGSKPAQPVDRSLQGQQDAAAYMAANPLQFGFDPNKSQQENYQAAAYIQAHPEQFNMALDPVTGKYTITQIG